jgi:hypothetical protein
VHAGTSYFICPRDCWADPIYRIDEAKKRDAKLRWALPDRVFFACGACHILAFAFLERYGSSALKATWIKPASGFTGNHIFIAANDWVFDYHGDSYREHFFTHTYRKAGRWWPGWQATLVEHLLTYSFRNQSHEPTTGFGCGNQLNFSMMLYPGHAASLIASQSHNFTHRKYLDFRT